VTLPAGAHHAQRVGGGDINDAYRVTLADGADAFVKTRADIAPGEYAAEAAGLRWLAEPRALRTPRVLDVNERYLALQWIAPPAHGRAGARLSDAGVEELGRGLAVTHSAGAPCFGLPARAERAAGFGSLQLSNAPTARWAEFYAERRLLPLSRLARERHAISAATAGAVERVCARLDQLCGPPEPPARLHGDLWAGNVIADAHARPWLIDPSAYGGHREVDLAMLRLFGTPGGQRVFAAYEEVAPLADGWRERVELYQLLPLLVHALLFGGHYADAVARAASRYAR
jgi:fructosamine-3-kinase